MSEAAPIRDVDVNTIRLGPTAAVGEASGPAVGVTPGLSPSSLQAVSSATATASARKVHLFKSRSF
jgi:hypothetical protein